MLRQAPSRNPTGNIHARFNCNHHCRRRASRGGGGLTSSEALALGKPLLIFNPIPGQEAANSDFLLERGAAVKVNRLEDLPYRLGQLLGSDKLKDMAKAAKSLGRPDAARAVCQAVVELSQSS
jgi:UDP-N-acetylglucosamine:LPS N-acetylglucosamine transferase